MQIQHCGVGALKSWTYSHGIGLDLAVVLLSCTFFFQAGCERDSSVPIIGRLSVVDPAMGVGQACKRTTSCTVHAIRIMPVDPIESFMVDLELDLPSSMGGTHRIHGRLVDVLARMYRLGVQDFTARVDGLDWTVRSAAGRPGEVDFTRGNQHVATVRTYMP